MVQYSHIYRLNAGVCRSSYRLAREFLRGTYQQEALQERYCTLRDGVGYIKDLTAVLRDQQQQQRRQQHQSPDLAKISLDNALRELIIVDNSPVSYAMNVDNAIQVEG